MWASFFTIAVAAGVCLSAVNLVSEINKIHDGRHSAVVEYRMPSDAPPSERATDAGEGTIRKPVGDPGA
jgi:hypothetical protein